ncbi:MAG: hypothetical protein N3B14_03925 [Thermoleophilia bacterium]|nr:hypothetical protein [Thermoleophilia bacterium]
MNMTWPTSLLRKPKAVLAVMATVALASSLILASCEEKTSLPTPSSTQSSLSSTTSITSPGGSTSLESPAQIWAASVRAVESLGPTRVSISEKYTWQGGTSNSSPAAVEGSASSQIEELLDPPHRRARLTVTASDGTTKTVTIDGLVKTTVTWFASATGGLASYQQRHLLKPPSGLPLPLYAGGMLLENEDYTKLLELSPQTDSPAQELTSTVQTERSSEGLLLKWDSEAKQLRPQGEFWPKSAQWRLLLDSATFLPRRLEVDLSGELEGVTLVAHGVLEYKFDGISGLTEDDVFLSPPTGPNEKVVVRELDPNSPYSPSAKWGQYWLGPTFGRLVVRVAEHRTYELSSLATDNTQTESDDAVILTYAAAELDENSAVAQPGIEASPTPRIQMETRAPLAENSRTSREWAEQRVLAGNWQRLTDRVAGRRALIYVGPQEQIEQPWGTTQSTSVCVLLDDAWVTLTLDPGIAPEDVLPLIQPVR